MPAQPSVRWNAKKERWMSWVRMPDGSRRKIERVEKVDAEADLAEALAVREGGETTERKRAKRATFEQVLRAWLAAGAPNVNVGGQSRVRHVKVKSDTTIDRLESIVNTHLSPGLGALWVESTRTSRLEQFFRDLDKERSTATVSKAWQALNTAITWGCREGIVKMNPAATVMLPEAKPSKERKTLQVDQIEQLMTAIPQDPRAAMWLTALMCGLRPGEMLGLRWCYVDVDSDAPRIKVEERAHYRRHIYDGQRDPKKGSKRTLDLHPLNVAALIKHREEQQWLDQYRFVEGDYVADGFVFPTRNGKPHKLGNARKYLGELFVRAGIGVSGCEEHDDCEFTCEGREVFEDWTTYELRHSFVSLADDALGDLRQVADVVGHIDTKTTLGYRHSVRESLPHAVEAWNRLLVAEQPA